MHGLHDYWLRNTKEPMLIQMNSDLDLYKEPKRLHDLWSTSVPVFERLKTSKNESFIPVSSRATGSGKHFFQLSNRRTHTRPYITVLILPGNVMEIAFQPCHPFLLLHLLVFQSASSSSANS